MILSQFLSMAKNFLASTGIYLAISPPVKTASRFVQSYWTLTQRSSVSFTSEKSLIEVST